MQYVFAGLNSNHQVRLVAATCWIDALCIIQNSQDDWQLESSKMDVVCSILKAQVNIAADGSKPATESVSTLSPRPSYERGTTVSWQKNTPGAILLEYLIN